MKQIKDSLPAPDKKTDVWLLAAVLILVAFGLVMIYSTSAYNGALHFDDKTYYLKKQFFATSLGLLVMYIMSSVPCRFWRKYALAAYMAANLLSIAVLFFGTTVNGSKRWLALGPLSFQPSEFAKLAVIVFLAHLISSRENRKNQLRFLISCFVLILPIVVLVGSNNLSTAIIILGIAVVMIFIAYPKSLPFLWVALAGIVMMAVFLSLESYRMERLLIWKNPEMYEKGYQTLQGLFAIGSGGLFGKGLGQSLQKLGFVPEAQNDMVFSIVCEELGLVGALLVLGVFAVMLRQFYVIAKNSRDQYAFLICSGVFAHIAIQIILNVAVVTNSIPNTGITFPFVSYGGTSVVFLLAEMGLVLNISKEGHSLNA